MPIRRLSVQLANQIAAGEVVERPASVVKELMENAIDAGATDICLEIRTAGKMLIRVTDNGSGIPAEELPIALAQHATSKISTLDDLNAITTLGFRGEALASIASVSKFTIISKTKEQSRGEKITTDGFQNPPVQGPAAHPVGTSVIVEELFFNTPARRRFLKADKTEFNHIRDLFIRIALVNPEISFRFVSEGRVVYQLPRTTYPEISHRMAKLLGNEFAREGVFFDNSSNEFKRWMQTLGVESLHIPDEVLRIKGVLLPPASLAKPMPERLLTFLNQRVVSDRVVNHAIRDSYANALIARHDAYKPALRAVFFMNISPYEIDVNVHPRKDEVRFHDIQVIHESISTTLRVVMAHMGLTKDRAHQAFLGIEQKAREDADARGVARPVFNPAPVPQYKPEARVHFETKSSPEEKRRVEANLKAYFEAVPAAQFHVAPAREGAAQLPGRLCNFFTLRSLQEEAKARQKAQEAAPFLFNERNAQGEPVRTHAPRQLSLPSPEQKSKSQMLADLLERQRGSEPQVQPKTPEELAEFAKAEAFAKAAQLLQQPLEVKEPLAQQKSAAQAQVSPFVAEQSPLRQPEQKSSAPDAALSLEDALNATIAADIEQKRFLSNVESAPQQQKEELAAQASSFLAPVSPFAHKEEPPFRLHTDGSLFEGVPQEALQQPAQEQVQPKPFQSMPVAEYQTRKTGQPEVESVLETTALPRPSCIGGTAASEQVFSSYSRQRLALEILETFPSSEQSEFLSLIAPDILLFRIGHKYFMACGRALFFCLVRQRYWAQVRENAVSVFPMPLPFVIQIEKELHETFKREDMLALAKRCGFVVKLRRQSVEIHTIPQMLHGANIAIAGVKALEIIASGALKPTDEQVQCCGALADLVAGAQNFRVASDVDAQALISKIVSLESIDGIQSPRELRELKLFEWAQSMNTRA